MNKSKKYITFLWIAVLSLFWEIASRTEILPSYIFPPLSNVIKAFVDEILFKDFGKIICGSLKTVFYGFIISLFLAIVIASISIKSKIFETLFTTLHGIFNPLPSIAILPIVILITGLSYKSIIILICHAVFWPLFATISTSFHTIPKALQDFSINIELSNFKSIIYIYIPAIFPHMITGMKSSFGRAWRALISAEAIFGVSSGSVQGLGFYIYTNRAYANMTNVFVGIISIIIISIAFEALFTFIEKHTVKKWKMTK